MVPAVSALTPSPSALGSVTAYMRPVMRGMDGTTAAIHVKGAPVKFIDQAVEREYIAEGDDFGFDGIIS